MTAALDITQQAVLGALAPFVVSVLGIAQSQVIQGLGNRVPMPPAAPGFVALTPISRTRLRTNIDTWDTTITTPTSFMAEQGTQLDVQIDCYGPVSGDWAQILSTLLRDEYGCEQLAPICQPLHADDPRMAPLTNAEEQYEERWIVLARLQYNPVVTFPQLFADALEVTLIDVNEAYPP